jgi:hypothetical protein
MKQQRCQYWECRRLAMGIWTNWGHGMTFHSCDQHRYPVRRDPQQCWRWVRNPRVKYGVWEKYRD